MSIPINCSKCGKIMKRVKRTIGRVEVPVILNNVDYMAWVCVCGHKVIIDSNNNILEID
jgi:hypothetical protein